ncbi:MAG: DUF3568 family protein [Verrucomicrobia bacterium]|nr:DUF3568 family protein [Verrucomicrobiota bacterium]
MKSEARPAGIKLLLLSLSAAGLTGCAALLVGGAVAAGAAAGVGAAAYSKGELRATENATLDQAWAAVPAAMQDYGVTVVDKARDELNATVQGQTPDKTKIVVKLKNAGKGTTDVRIRVGTFGNETISRQILEAMRKHYGSPAHPASAGPATPPPAAGVEAAERSRHPRPDPAA